MVAYYILHGSFLNFIFGVLTPPLPLLHIKGKIINWSDRIKYIGCHFHSGRTKVDPSSCVGKFCGAFNNILNVLRIRRD